MLRHAALLLDRENQRLHEKIKTLLAENARLRGEDSTILQHELAFLQELLAQRNRALFGSSSEKRPAGPTAEPGAAGRPARAAPTAPGRSRPRAR